MTHYSPQAQERIKRNRHIKKKPAKRQSFRAFWRTFTMHRDKPRPWRRFIAREMWRSRKRLAA